MRTHDQVARPHAGFQVQFQLWWTITGQAQRTDSLFRFFYPHHRFRNFHLTGNFRPALGLNRLKSKLLDGIHLTAHPPQATFSLACIWPGNIPFDKIKILLQVFFFSFINLLQSFPTRLSLVKISTIIAVVQVDCRSHLNDGGNHLVEEITVMRNEQDSTTPFTKIRFQPLDSGNIQVIGRFIQQ